METPFDAIYKKYATTFTVEAVELVGIRRCCKPGVNLGPWHTSVERYNGMTASSLDCVALSWVD
jgi:hypothetical protein